MLTIDGDLVEGGLGPFIRWWVEEGSGRLAGDMQARLAARLGAASHAGPVGADSDEGHGFEVSYAWTFDVLGGRRHEQGKIDPSSWAAFLRVLEERPDSFSFAFGGQAPPTATRVRSKAGMGMGGGVLREDRRWWTVRFSGDLELFLSAEEHEAAMLDFLKEAAGRVPATYGEVHYEHLGRSSLEDALQRPTSVGIPESRRVLRGYSYVTIAGPEISEALGGVEVLGRSGAFAAVEQLPSGGVWLQAVPRFQDYDLEVAEKVFRVLAPVLPGGLPWSDATFDFPHIVVLQDAREVGPAPTTPADERG
jgi:hypothetical protein